MLIIATLNGLIFNIATFILVAFNIVVLIIVTLNGLAFDIATFIVVAFNIVALNVCGKIRINKLILSMFYFQMP